MQFPMALSISVAAPQNNYTASRLHRAAKPITLWQHPQCL